MGLCDFKMSLGETRSLYCWWDKSAGQIHKGVARINFSYHRHKATQKNFNSPPTPLSGHGWVRKTFNNACHVLLMWVEIVALGSWIILVLIHLFCLQTTCCPCAAGQGLEGVGGQRFMIYTLSFINGILICSSEILIYHWVTLCPCIFTHKWLLF